MRENVTGGWKKLHNNGLHTYAVHMCVCERMKHKKNSWK